MDMSLKNKAFSGVAWTFSHQLSVQAINFVVQIMLARILLPEMFGIIALLQIFIAIGTALLEGGMTSSLIRMREPDQADYSTVFYINLFISLLIYGILFLCAPLIADFYKQPILDPVVKVYTLTFVIQGLVAVQTTRLTKEMNFKLQMFMQLPSVVIGGVLGIYLAKKGYGVWSLVWMNIVRSFIFMILHWVYSDWRPGFIISKEKLRYHFGFGYKLTFSGILTSLYYNLYTIIIGKFFSATQLGYYQQANQLSLFTVANLSTALQKVSFPLFSSINDDDEKLRMVYKRITDVVFFVCTPLMMIFVVNATPIFRLVLTEKWLPAVPFFQVLCIAYIFYPFSMYNMSIMPAKGRSDLHFKAEIVKKGISALVLLLVMLYSRTLWAILWAAAFSIVFQTVVNAYYAGKLIKYPTSAQFRNLLPILVTGAVATAVCMVFARFVLDSMQVPDIVYIIIQSLLYLGVYLALSYVLRLSAWKESTEMVGTLKNKFLKKI